MTIKTRIEKLEGQPSKVSDVALLKPSDILRAAKALIAGGAVPTADDLKRIEALEKLCNPK